MRKILILTITAITLLSCASKKKIDGTTYDTYGLANELSNKNDSIQYEVSPGSVICAIIFCETIIAPVYILGWDLYQPVRKIDPAKKGIVD